jgi:hypothetical protein
VRVSLAVREVLVASASPDDGAFISILW